MIVFTECLQSLLLSKVGLFQCTECESEASGQNQITKISFVVLRIEDYQRISVLRFGILYATNSCKTIAHMLEEMQNAQIFCFVHKQE